MGVEKEENVRWRGNEIVVRYFDLFNLIYSKLRIIYIIGKG